MDGVYVSCTTTTDVIHIARRKFSTGWGEASFTLCAVCILLYLLTGGNNFSQKPFAFAPGGDVVQQRIYSESDSLRTNVFEKTRGAREAVKAKHEESSNFNPFF